LSAGHQCRRARRADRARADRSTSKRSASRTHPTRAFWGCIGGKLLKWGRRMSPLRHPCRGGQSE
jgi:hypothetical protein